MLSDTSFDTKLNNSQSPVFDSPQKKRARALEAQAVIDAKNFIPSQKNALLGKDANRVVKSEKNEKYGDFRRLAFAQKLLFEKDVKAVRSGKIHRTRLCHSCRTFNAESISLNVSKNPNKNRASFSGLQTCANVWACPVCSKRIATERGKDITKVNKKMTETGHVPIMITLTASHTINTPLRSQVENFRSAWDMLKRDGTWTRQMKRLGIKHRILAREITWGAINGWHYHMHMLLFVNADLLKALDAESLQNWRDKLTTRWISCLKNNELTGDFEHALNVKASGNVKASYISKLGLESDTTNVDYELTSGRQKNYKGRNIWNILRRASEGDEWCAKLYVEYVRVMSGNFWITWSRGLKDLCEIDVMTDEEIAETTPDAEEMTHLMDITDEEYMPVRKLRKFAELLELAGESKSENNVRYYLEELMVEYNSSHKTKDDRRMLEQYQSLDKTLTAWRKAYNRRSWRAGKAGKSFLDEQPEWVVDSYKKWNELRDKLHIRD